MPSKTLIGAATAPETSAVLLTLLTISVDGVPRLYFTNNNEPVISNGTTFIPWGFSAVLPDQTTDGSRACKLQIDNTDLSVYRIIKSSISHKITCDIAVILSDTPDEYEQGPLNFTLRNIKADVSVITADLLDGYMQDRKVTHLSYTPEDFPGLFY